ncbi:hypothetical protein YH63_009850 [Afipia massiliensis]|uniref:Uncharacterized protein n=1 Tax=Afipia massiliensis TaxID=211460 RepID=A0A4U6BSF0_9BRAD|nr:hypothetical protein [Afipia massiliensis]TKT71694.1 hypothetical protein YH63_009850 [Afipia massiliensis]
MTGAQDAMAGREGLKRVLRFFGIVAIFTVVGPLTVAAIVSLLIVALGAPLLQLLLAVADLDALRSVASFAAWLLAAVAILASFLPSVAAGTIFAWTAVYADINAIWMAWLAAGIAAAGFIVFGMFIHPSESSALILPSVQSPAQALSLFSMLGVLAFLAASFCWWLARPLHRVKHTP